MVDVGHAMRKENRHTDKFMSNQIQGFVIQVSPHSTEEELKDLSTTIYNIKGVLNVTPIKRKFEWYGLFHAIENEVAKKVFAALTKEG